MQILSLLVLATAALTAATSFMTKGALLGVFAVELLFTAYVCFLSRREPTYLRVTMAVFTLQACGSGLINCATAFGYLPETLNESVSVPVSMSFALFTLISYGLTFVPFAYKAVQLSERYFELGGEVTVPLWGTRTLTLSNRAIGIFYIAFNLLFAQFRALLNLVSALLIGDIFDAVQTLDSSKFWTTMLWKALPIALTQSLVGLVASNLLEMCRLHWHSRLTEDYTRRWLALGSNYRIALMKIGGDNPDQRIHQDVPGLLTGNGLGLFAFASSMTQTVGGFVAYAVVLWEMSSRIKPFGSDAEIPGLLLWIVILGAALTTFITFKVAAPLVPMAEEQQKADADYRFSLGRAREYSEQITLLKGNRTEFEYVIGNFFAWLRLRYLAIMIQLKLGGYGAVLTQGKEYIQYFLFMPMVFSKDMTFGQMQIAGNAMGSVSMALEFFAQIYTGAIHFRATVVRLAQLDEALHAANAPPPADRVLTTSPAGIEMEKVAIRLPSGEQLYAPISITFRSGENVLVSGPSGVGKSTLFRTLSGEWPFWSGKLALPQDQRVLTLPQRSYIPMGTLMRAISYPEPEGTYSREAASHALEAAGLADLKPELDLVEDWTQKLSGGEQQRLAFARALLMQPKWLLLDEATSALDATYEKMMYDLVRREMPDTTIISIAHRESVTHYHQRHLRIRLVDGGAVVDVDAPLEKQPLVSEPATA